MPIFEVIRKETSSEHCFVDAESQKQAKEIAEQLDSNAWKQNQDYNGKLTATKANPAELKGRIINKAENEFYYYEPQTTEI